MEKTVKRIVETDNIMKYLYANELDIQVPSLKDFNIEKFHEMTQQNYEKQFKDKEFMYFKKNNLIMPWQRRIIMLDGNLIINIKDFPFLSDIVNLSNTLIEFPSIVSIYQEKQPLQDLIYHFDKYNNTQEFSYRICYGLSTNDPFLEFSKLKPEHANVKSNFSDNMFEDKIYSFKPKKSDTVIGITEKYFPHRVPYINSSGRLVFAVVGNFKEHSYKTIQECFHES